MLGATDGAVVGMNVVGTSLGAYVAFNSVGANVGVAVGKPVGVMDGAMLGAVVGEVVVGAAAQKVPLKISAIRKFRCNLNCIRVLLV